MRKLILYTVALSVLLSFAACSWQDAPGGDLFGEPTDTTPSNEWTFDENTPMFFCQDRYDIEGDRYAVYQYNYKGDLLSSSSSNYIGFYAENGLAPAIDPASGKVGFVNKDGVFVINPIYENAASFSPSGLALVSIKNAAGETKCGFINTDGIEVIPCQFDNVSSFYPSGYAYFSENTTDNSNAQKKLYGVINENGEVVLEPSYNKILWIYEDYLVVRLPENNNEAVVNFSGTILDQIERFVKIDGKTVIQCYQITPSTLYRNTFENGTVLRRLLTNQEIFDGKQFVEQKSDYEITYKHVATTPSGIGFGVTKNGETVIPYQYDIIYRVGTYFVAIHLTNYDNSQSFDIYDSSFQKTAENIPYSLFSPWLFEQTLPNGYFYVYDTEDDYALYGIIDYTGNVIVEPVHRRGVTFASYIHTGNFPSTTDFQLVSDPGI